MVFLIQTDLPGWQMASAMSHAIHKIGSKRRCQSYFISRRSPHHVKSKNRDLWASSQSRFLFCLCAAHCSRNSQFTRFRSASRSARSHLLLRNHLPDWNVCIQKNLCMQKVGLDVALLKSDASDLSASVSCSVPVFPTTYIRLAGPVHWLPVWLHP